MVDPGVPFTSVTASRGKVARAELIAALYEQGRGPPYGWIFARSGLMLSSGPSRS
jgi:phage terminase large subunit-like protein